MVVVLAEERANYDVFRECISEAIIHRLSAPRKSQKKRNPRRVRHKIDRARTDAAADRDESQRDDVNEDGHNDAEELSDFIEYIASEIFTCLPPDLRSLNHKTYTSNPTLRDRYADPLPSPTREAITASQLPEVTESLASYADPQVLTLNAITAYIASVTTAPPPPAATRPESNECEMCGRDQLPLTYHHLIPRESHERVLKRGWHPEEDLNNVAWICRACHNFVHGIASNEELAREWYSVELLMSREDVQRFAKWIGRVRWKSR